MGQVWENDECSEDSFIATFVMASWMCVCVCVCVRACVYVCPSVRPAVTHLPWGPPRCYPPHSDG